MPTIPAANDQWYVIHVLSGQELKVRDNIERRRDSEEMSDLIFEVLVPQERISEVKGGQKREANRKFYPGYIIINMHLLNEDNTLVDRTWYFIQETDGIINFAGTKGNPMPMPNSNPPTRQPTTPAVRPRSRISARVTMMRE
jgi:transcriptional antiterminator NusG